MLNLFTILVFLFVLLGVLGLRAFTNRARREEMVRERLTELLTQVEEEAKSVAPVEYPDESVLMGLDDYHGHFPKLMPALCAFRRDWNSWAGPRTCVFAYWCLALFPSRLLHWWAA